eukprot:scaffold21819_cov65-Phaeocystis_antarctica.AAC.1
MSHEHAPTMLSELGRRPSRGTVRRGTLWSLSLPHPADAGGDEDTHEQHRADRHAGDDAGHGAVNSEHVVVQPGKDVADAHEGSDESCAGERNGALLQVAYAPNLCELRIDLAPVGVRMVLDVLPGSLLEM